MFLFLFIVFEKVYKKVYKKYKKNKNLYIIKNIYNKNHSKI